MQSTEELMFFKLWCWGRLLRVSWTERRSKQPIFKEIKPEYPWTDAEAESSLLWPPDAKSIATPMMQLIGKDPGKIEGRRRRGRQRTRCLNDITDLMNMHLSKLWEIVKDRKPNVLSSLATAKSQTRLGDRTTSKG